MVLDDASHASHHQQITLATLFPFLKSGGMYIIEDLHWQPEELEQDSILTTRTILRDFLSDGGKFKSTVLSEDENLYLERNIDSIQLVDSKDRLNADTKDGPAVIFKR